MDEIVGKSGRRRAGTRAAALTWVHSNTGMKLPVRRIAERWQREQEARRDGPGPPLRGRRSRVGVEDVKVADLGCDFFASGCHKWLFGPRGTGVGLGPGPPPGARMTATIPSIPTSALGRAGDAGRLPLVRAPLGAARGVRVPPAGGQGPHRGARPRPGAPVPRRAAQDEHVKVYTPPAALASGMVCFDVDGLKPQEVVDRLFAKQIIASTTPYDVSYARLAPSMINTPAEVDTVLAGVRAFASA